MKFEDLNIFRIKYNIRYFLNKLCGSSLGMANGERPIPVHVRDNSEGSIEQLFGVLTKDQRQSAYKDRNLPSSFFKCPQRPAHSGSSHPTQSHHGRSLSSPALSSQPLAVPQHGRQSSADLLGGDTWNPSDNRPASTFHQFK